jgi:hypothetical protein
VSKVIAQVTMKIEATGPAGVMLPPPVFQREGDSVLVVNGSDRPVTVYSAEGGRNSIVLQPGDTAITLPTDYKLIEPPG